MTNGLYSRDAERACLGAALLDNTFMRSALDRLTVADFGLSAHRELFALMLESCEEGLPFDALTLAESLKQRNMLEPGGGFAYLDELPDGVVPQPSLIERHAETVKRLSKLRRLQELAERMGHEAGEVGGNPDCLLQKWGSVLEGLRAGYDLDGNLTPVAMQKPLRRPELLRLSDVEAREVDWLWKPYLANGMLAMLSGDPGAGKTYITLAVAAAITTGRVPYTGEHCEPADVLYLSVENRPEYVVRPRFDSLGGDTRRFHILQGTITGQGNGAVRGSVRLSDVSLLHHALQETVPRLVIVDPIQSYLGAEVDAHRSNETRPVMDGLSRLAEEHGCCILLVRHLGKAPSGRAIHRGLGSIDLSAAVRTELLAGCSPDDPGQRALVQVKSNLGQFGSALGYTIEGPDGTFRWTGESELTAAALLAPESNEEETGAMAEAKDFLASALANGARPAKDVEAEARQERISKRTLERAKKALGVKSHKCGMTGAWKWFPPEDCQT